LIISPLISLMHHQLIQINLKPQTHLPSIHSAMHQLEKTHNIKPLTKTTFIYLTPQYIFQPHNFNYIPHINFPLILLHQPHCLSHSPYHFTPHYPLLPKIIHHFNSPTVLPLTPT
ncbi:DEAD/DEAH box helicase family protein, partial [Staphylococcus epidermidis]